jgi:uridine kinase
VVRRTDLLEPLISAVEERIPSSRPGRSALLVGISGIDGSGKGTVTRRLANELVAAGRKVATIDLDSWHHPAAIRFSRDNPGEHFYRHAFRFGELLERLIDPLHQDGSVCLDEPLVDPVTDTWYRKPYDFEGVEVILFEGIFLFARQRRMRFDLSIWVHCPFDVALDRALTRNQEGRPLNDLREDYERIYTPAQRIHLEQDDPEAFADLIFLNG